MFNLWDNLYDKFKDCRYGALFLASVLAFFGVLLVGAVTAASLRTLSADSQYDLERYFLESSPALVILLIAWVILKLRRAQRRSRERSRYAPLSRDELRIARSKLRNGTRPIHRPAPRAPDTNLKY